nr:SPOR domain-containing protein [uncultured Pseudomonas sp.]
MRWMFLLFVVLNLFYYVWHQQQAPLRVNEIEAVSAPAAGQGEIRLLSESQAPARRPVADPSAREAVCLFLGSFDQQSEAAVVEQRLLSLDIRSSVQSVDAVGGVDYWVYLAPLGSRQASLRQLRELQARKIDSYIITEGDLANGISLGIFPRSDSAESVMQRLRGAGYEPEMRELPRAQRSYWVRIAPESRRLADDFLLQRLATDFNGLQHQLMPCEGIASPR